MIFFYKKYNIFYKKYNIFDKKYNIFDNKYNIFDKKYNIFDKKYNIFVETLGNDGILDNNSFGIIYIIFILWNGRMWV